MSTHAKRSISRALAASLLPLLLAASVRAQRPQLEFESGHLGTIHARQLTA